MKINNDLSTSLFKPRTPIGLIICYLVLGLPASLGIGSLIAQLLTFNISNFEGGSGYAWIWIFIIVSSVTYLACLIILPILLKKYVQALSTLVVIFGILGLFSLFFITSL